MTDTAMVPDATSFTQKVRERVEALYHDLPGRWKDPLLIDLGCHNNESRPIISDTASTLQTTSIRGQSLTDLFSPEEVQQIRDARELQTLFSNGAGVDLNQTTVTEFRETKNDKALSQAHLRLLGYRPSDRLILAAVKCFGKATKQHFVRDSIFLLHTMAAEIGMNFIDFTNVRGWVVTVDRKTGSIQFAYRRIRECLESLAPQNATNYRRIHAHMERLYSTITAASNIGTSAAIGMCINCPRPSPLANSSPPTSFLLL